MERFFLGLAGASMVGRAVDVEAAARLFLALALIPMEVRLTVLHELLLVV